MGIHDLCECLCLHTIPFGHLCTNQNGYLEQNPLTTAPVLEINFVHQFKFLLLRL